MNIDTFLNSANLLGIKVLKECGERFIESDPKDRPKARYTMGGEVAYSDDKKNFGVRVTVGFASFESDSNNKLIEITVAVQGDYSLPEPFGGADEEFIELSKKIGSLQLTSHAVLRVINLLRTLGSRHIPVIPLVWKEAGKVNKLTPRSSIKKSPTKVPKERKQKTNKVD